MHEGAMPICGRIRLHIASWCRGNMKREVTFLVSTTSNCLEVALVLRWAQHIILEMYIVLLGNYKRQEERETSTKSINCLSVFKKVHHKMVISRQYKSFTLIFLYGPFPLEWSWMHQLQSWIHPYHRVLMVMILFPASAALNQPYFQHGVDAIY